MSVLAFFSERIKLVGLFSGSGLCVGGGLVFGIGLEKSCLNLSFPNCPTAFKFVESFLGWGMVPLGFRSSLKCGGYAVKRIRKPADFSKYTHRTKLPPLPEQRKWELLCRQQFLFWGGARLTRELPEEWAVIKIAEGRMKSLVKRVHRHLTKKSSEQSESTVSYSQCFICRVWSWDVSKIIGKAVTLCLPCYVDVLEVRQARGREEETAGREAQEAADPEPFPQIELFD